MVELKGFPDLVGGGGGDNDGDSDGDMDTAKMVQDANRMKKKKSGGFQSMGLSQEVEQQHEE